jgi:lipopolysaccharide export system protein LptA
MTNIKFISKKRALISSAFFLMCFTFTSSCYGQILELLPGAEKLAYDEATGRQRLIGAVNFNYQGNTMYCDSAHYYQKQNIVHAYGHVHINKNDTLNLFCDSLYYDGNKRLANLYGNVSVRDQDYKITTQQMDYDAKNSVGIYRNWGRIESLTSTEVLTSKVGYFYPNSKNLFFKGNVKYKSPEYTMTTDTLRYTYTTQTAYFFGPTIIQGKELYAECDRGYMQMDKQIGSFEGNAKLIKDGKEVTGDKLFTDQTTGISKGSGKVVVKDTAAQQTMRGEQLFSNEKLGYSYITGKALVEKYSKKDTLYAHADTLHYYQDTLKEGIAIRGSKRVRILKGEMAAIADSLYYDFVGDVVKLYQHPIIWAKNGELKADSMRIFMDDSTIRYVEIIQKATVIMEVDSGRFYNQIGGNNMFCYFENEELNRVDVKSNSRTLFFPTEENKNDTAIIVKRIGMMKMYSKDIRVYLDSGELKGITYLAKPEGSFFPLEQVTEENRTIENFSWQDSLRPKSQADLVAISPQEILENEAKAAARLAAEKARLEKVRLKNDKGNKHSKKKTKTAKK